LGCSSGAVSLPSEHDNSFLSSEHNNSSLGDSSSPSVAPSGSKVAIDGSVKFDATLSGPAALSERLRLLLPVMSNSGGPIYMLESKSVLKFSQKRKDAQLYKDLLAESVTATTASHSPLGLHSSLSIETVAVRKPPVNLFRRGFLLPCNPSVGPPLSIEVGESLKRCDFKGVAAFYFQKLGVSHARNVKAFWHLMTQVDEE